MRAVGGHRALGGHARVADDVRAAHLAHAKAINDLSGRTDLFEDLNAAADAHYRQVRV